MQDREDLAVPVVPVYIQEKIHPHAIIDALPRIKHTGDDQTNLFADFNGLEDDFEKKVDFYSQKDDRQKPWSNRLILGDSLLVMTSLAEKEGLKGKVQAIYLDPPYGIKFGSNWQVSTRKRNVKDGSAQDATRQPEQVRAFRDTWKLGIHSYLAYLRDRLVVARDLLTETGSVFVQIGDENVHLVRNAMDEVFGSENFCRIIPFAKTASTATKLLSEEFDYLVWYAKQVDQVKYHQLYLDKIVGTFKSYKYLESPAGTGLRTLTADELSDQKLIPDGWRVLQISNLASQDPGKTEERGYTLGGVTYDCGTSKHWKTTNPIGLDRLKTANRLLGLATQLNFKRYLDDYPATPLTNVWGDTGSAGYSASDPKVYVVQTDSKVIERCLLMTTDPGDLVLDPTCGSGTTAYVAEQWGRRWITCDTSRVALALARTRLMAAKNQDGTVSEQEGRKQQDFSTMILENLKKAGVQNTLKSERISFDRLDPYAGAWLHAAGEYTDADAKSRRVAVSIGPEHGTVGPQQVKEAAKEAVQGVGFDMLVVCGFAFDPHVAEEVKRYGNLTVLPTKMNPDLAMGDELLKKTGAGNLFMVFGEPDVEIKKQKNGQIVIGIKGVDVYDPTTGQIRTASTDDIACWFIDSNYNGESFFVRHAYFTGAKEPYDNLKRALRAEIDEAAWSSLYSTVSRAFDKPETGKFAVKVINHYGDEVLKVFEI